MNTFRINIMARTFKKLDKEGTGAVKIEDVKEAFMAMRHPDVISKKKTEEDILSEFLDTFDQFSNELSVLFIEYRITLSI